MSGVIVHELYADLNKTEVPHYDKITLRAGNDNDIIVVHILNDGVDFKAYTQFTFSCVKSDGHVYISDKINSNGSIRYTVNSQVVSVGGELRNAYFTLYNGGELVGSTPDLPIKVLRDADASLGSSDYVNGLDKIKQDVEDRYQQLAQEIKVSDADSWLNSLHKEFSDKNDAYMASVKKTVDDSITSMQNSARSALTKMQSDIAGIQGDISSANAKVTELNDTIKKASDAVADINIPQIKADVDTANTNAQLALQQVENKAEKSGLIQFVTVKQMQQVFYNLLMKGNVTITNSSGNDSTSTLNNAVSQLDTMSTFAKVAEIPTINKNNNFNDDWYGTQSQYDGLASKSSTTNYHITE